MTDYKVGIELLLASNGEAVLGILGRRLLGIQGKVQDLEGGFGRLKLAIGGAFAIGGAMALLGVMDKLIKKGADLEQSMYRLQTIGLTPKEMKDVKSNASRVANRFPNLSERELVKLTGETTAVYGDPQTAMRNLGIAAAYVSAVKYRHPEDAEGAAATAEDAIFKILRSEEMRGLAQNPAEIKRALAATLKGQEVFGDQFDPTTSFQAVKYGRLASRYLSDRFLEGPGLVLAQELGGSNMGNSLNQVMQALVGGHVTKTSLATMERIGLVDPKKIKRPRGSGSFASFNLTGAIPKSALLQSDPDQWFASVFRPIIDKASGGDPAKRDQLIRQLFYRTTGQQMAEILGWQTGPDGRITKDVKRLKVAMTPEQAVAAAQINLATSSQNLATQFDRLAAALGDPLAKAGGHVAGGLAGPIQSLANAAAQHPGLSAAVDGVLAASAAALAVTGTKWLLTAAKPILGLLGGAGPEAAAVQKAVTTGPAVANAIRAVGGALAGLEAAPMLVAAGSIGALAIAVWGLPRALYAATQAINETLGIHGSTQPGNGGHGGRGGTHDKTGSLNPWSPHKPESPPAHVYLDGRKVGNVIVQHLTKGGDLPSAGPGTFDATRGYSPVGMPTN